MSKDFARTFYSSGEWLACRESYIKSLYEKGIGGLCERCLRHNDITPGYIVHHKEKLTPENINNPDITLNHNNLEYVCLKCHNEDEFGEHSGAPKPKAICAFDSEGNIYEVK